MADAKTTALIPAWEQYQQRYRPRLLPELCLTDSPDHAGVVIAIPAFSEPGLIRTLDSLEACPVSKTIDIWVLLNAPEMMSEPQAQVHATSEQDLRQWMSRPRKHGYAMASVRLPQKKAGVGLARKILMDNAARVFAYTGCEGWIVCLDADCTVSPNYLESLATDQPQDAVAASLRFAHPLGGSDFEAWQYQAVYEYELHLRYYKNALGWAGFPHSIHTVGSSMAVRTLAYMKQGGMNTRKAGEDFYFMGKMLQLGKVAEWNRPCVYPSPRISGRVPFGTGRAIGEWGKEKSGRKTYAWRIFTDLKAMLDHIHHCIDEQKSPDLQGMQALFWERCDGPARWRELVRHTRTPESLRKRFFHWFDLFMLMKYVHFMREVFPDQLVRTEARKLPDVHAFSGNTDLLEIYRVLDGA